MFWCLLLLAKAGLFFAGYLRFDPIWNLGFLILVLTPTPEAVRTRRWARALRQLVIGASAALLFWHDSWLPPVGRAIEFLADPATVPSPRYLAEFIGRYLEWWAAPVLLLLLAVSAALRRSRAATAAALALTGCGIVAASAASIQQAGVPVAEAVNRFQLAESARTVQFEAGPGPAFDIVLLHVCSLSWNDLDTVGLRDHEFLRGFDVVFTNFNSVTSYSGTAALRLLRAGCGQRAHGELWSPARPDCYLLDRLRSQGFRSYAAMDHDGQYARFGQEARELGHLDIPESNEGIPVRQFNFDDSPILDGGAVLDRWWQQRVRDKAKRAVLYYNTITLHEGARWAGEAEPSPYGRQAQYRDAVERLFADLRRFLDRIESSGRNAMVILVAEHGAALGGSGIQASGLRELPLPQITRVPAAVKFVGGSWNRDARPIVIDRPVSYLALGWLIAEAVRRPPFGTTAVNLDLAGVPRTNFLAEIEGVRVAQYGSDYYIQRDGAQWARLPERALPRMPGDLAVAGSEAHFPADREAGRSN